MGPDVLKEVIEKAELYPIKGLFSFRDYYEEIDSYYHQTLGYELGVSTGWMALNELYNICGGSPLAKALDHEVVPGELTIVTGVPNSGKSEWIDALLCNLNERVGWKFALCSMENKTVGLMGWSCRLWLGLDNIVTAPIWLGPSTELGHGLEPEVVIGSDWVWSVYPGLESGPTRPRASGCSYFDWPGPWKALCEGGSRLNISAIGENFAGIRFSILVHPG
ncbi:unnamed protein product [Ilex paraguariensis]|uniref:SF4 helicase domain-containing protein n=1 Tax=Ilex paraguariensis TaxID=185542 RepID=A0ABC8S6R3_9AQUA